MPSEPKPPLHARRARRRQRFQASQERRAPTRLDAVARVFDRWRRGVITLPEKFANEEIDEVAAYLKDRARQLEPDLEEGRDDGH